MDEPLHIDIDEDDYDNDTMHGNKKSILNKKVFGLERFILVANFMLELPSAVFDQLSSVHKPQYALLSMLMSSIVLIICVIDLSQKCRKERVKWIIKGFIPWFYYLHPNPKPLGSFADIVGLICSVLQFVSASVAYAFLSRQSDNPVKINVWPLVFSFVLLYSKSSETLPNTKLSRRLKPTVKAQEFSLAELVTATDNFSDGNLKSQRECAYIYKGYLKDNCYVEIWRHKQMAELKKRPFYTQLELLPGLSHKNLVRLVGYCDEGEEKLLIFEDVKSTRLYDLLHDDNNINSAINSWKMRIKIALEAARGIQYLHVYAVPPIIHRDIKSFNIVVDKNFTARVSGFSYSLKVPELEHDYEVSLPETTIGTFGYIDPAYCESSEITAKSDVYSLGVVLLELLTGKPPIFRDGNDAEIMPGTLVDNARRKIMANALMELLDPRVGLGLGAYERNEGAAVKLLANTAFCCVENELENRPNVNEIVANLDEALSLCDRQVGH